MTDLDRFKPGNMESGVYSNCAGSRKPTTTRLMIMEIVQRPTELEASCGAMRMDDLWCTVGLKGSMKGCLSLPPGNMATTNQLSGKPGLPPQYRKNYDPTATAPLGDLGWIVEGCSWFVLLVWKQHTHKTSCSLVTFKHAYTPQKPVKITVPSAHTPYPIYV